MSVYQDMNDTHDMTEHHKPVKTAEASYTPMTPSEIIDEKASAEANVGKQDDGNKPTVIKILDPKLEHTRDAWHDLKASANNLFLTARYHSIRALPAAVVNNSTNILGLTHVMTEMMMLKASGADTKLIKNPKNPINWVWEPLQGVFTGTYQAAKVQKIGDRSLTPTSGNFVKDKYELIADTKLATKREIDRLERDQITKFEIAHANKFRDSDAYKTRVEPVLGKPTKETKKQPLTPEEITLAGPEIEQYEKQRLAKVETLRQKYKNELGISRVEVIDNAGVSKLDTVRPMALRKEKFKQDLTNELNGLSDNARAIRVKEYESELKEISGGPVYSAMRLSNPWQMRSTLAGLVVWALSAIIPDKKESDEEVERMAVLRSTNLPAYIGERFKEAVWVPQWASHKRQMIGLGIMTSGICSLLGSWRNRKTLLTDAEAVVESAMLLAEKGLLEKGAKGTIDVAGKEAGKIGTDIMKTTRYEYEFNPSYFATSLLTFLSSLPLLFASDSERGFSGFGTLMTGRLLFLPSSIGKKMRDKEPGVGFYTAGMASFQAENWAQALAGGAQKIKDPKTGNEIVVDHDADRKAAKIRAHAINTQKAEDKGTSKPSMQVSDIASREMAMPELVHEQQQKSSAV